MVKNGLYNIKSTKANLYVNVQWGKMENGRKIHLWNDPKSKSSQWKIMALSDGSICTILSNNDDKYGLNLCDGRKENGARIQLWKVTKTPDNNSVWKIVSNRKGGYNIQACRSQRFLNIKGGNTTKGTEIQQWDNPDSGDCNWELIPVLPSRSAFPSCLQDYENTRSQSDAASRAAHFIREKKKAATTVCTSEVPRFAVNDPNAMSYLSDNGYVVIRDTLCKTEVASAVDLLWEFLASATYWKRGQMKTWNEQRLHKIGVPKYGLVKAAGAGQSEFMWFVRTRNAVRKAFANIWGTDNLITSFDGFNIFLPWHHGFQKTTGGWLHCDQGRAKKGLQSIQGFVAITPHNATTGGLVVIPGSHHLHESWMNDVKHKNNFVQLPHDSPLQGMPQQLVTCRAGDLVLWDSRTVHSNTPATENPISPKGELLRVAGYVCMMPKQFASQDELKTRKAAYNKGMSCHHWPILKSHELMHFDNAGGYEVKSLSNVTDGREELIC